eukprot:TRINITY_DN535_c9_g1_i1.p1 TRINITY_DN535_c9_g1~~TRINITY_DN535_c9_g1_i1.p1  ORF type:complete len:1462 (+),score=369.02 TRINITY_DN535_c9_g1_i1:60-4388(+)
MGNCGCSGEAPKRGRGKMAAEHQARINETTAIVKQEIHQDVKDAMKEDPPEEPADKNEKKDPAKEKEKEAEQKRKLKKATKRLSKLELLERAKEVDAMSLDDYNMAIRRLTSVTGEDPTNPGRKYTLPETMEWLNTIIEVLWPSVGAEISRQVNELSRTMGININFTLGENTPAFVPLGMRSVDGIDGEQDGGVEFSLGITYRSNCKTEVELPLTKITIAGFTFIGNLFIWFRPIMDEIPIVGGVSFGFVNPPTIELDWEGGFGTVANITGLKATIQDAIKDQITEIAVIPNLLGVSLHKGIDIAKIRSPEPEGIIRLNVQRAANCPEQLFGNDLFVRVHIGGHTHDTKVVSGTKMPVWNDTFDYLVYNKEQWVLLELHEQGPLGSTVLGSISNLPVNRIAKRKTATVPFITKEGQPLITDEEVCTVTVTGQWLTISDSEITAPGADQLVTVSIADVKGVPLGAFQPPYRVETHINGIKTTEIKKAKVELDVDIDKIINNAGIAKLGIAKPGAFADSEEILRDIRTLHETGKQVDSIMKITGLVQSGDKKLIEQAIAKTGTEYKLGVNDDDGTWWKQSSYMYNHKAYPDASKVDKEPRLSWAAKKEGVFTPIASAAQLRIREEYYEKMETLFTWYGAIAATQASRHRATDPHFDKRMHLKTTAGADSTTKVDIAVIDGDGKVMAKLSKSVKDSTVGADADLNGPFPLEIGGKTATLYGSITIKAVIDTGKLPSNWNLRADAIDPTTAFNEWWQLEQYVQDWESKGEMWCAVDWPAGKKEKAPADVVQARDDFYMGKNPIIGSGVTDVKRASLEACLKEGALTWGDYDVLMGKLNGEKDVVNIAETLEWVNFFIMSIWQQMRTVTEDIVHAAVVPALNEVAKGLPGPTITIGVPKCDIGSKPFAMNTIRVDKVMQKNTDKCNGCTIHLNNMSFVSDMDIQVEINVSSVVGSSTFKVGLKDVLFRFSVQIGLTDLLDRAPYIGAAQVSLPNPPELAFDLTGIADIVDKIPKLNSLIASTVVDQMAQVCCIPNFIAIPLDPMVKSIDLAYPEPVGVVRIAIESCHHLPSSDTTITGSDAPGDIYINLRLGSQTHQTKAIKSHDPEFNEASHNTVDLIVYNLDQRLCISVMDDDLLQDDVVGKVHSLETVVGGGIDLVREGIPIRALKRLGVKATCDITRCKKDEVSSKATHKVYERVPVVGADKSPANIILSTTWLSTEGNTARVDAYLLKVTVNEITGIPAGLPLQGPFKVRASLSTKTVTSKSGFAKKSTLDIPNIIQAVRQMKEDGDSHAEIAATLLLDPEIVDEIHKLKEEDGHVDIAKAIHAAHEKNRATLNPQFMQHMRAVISVDNDDEHMRNGTWSTSVTLSILDKSENEIGTLEIPYNVPDCEDGIAGPFNVPVTIKVPKDVGMKFWQSSTDDVETVWKVHGAVLLQPIRKRVMDAD